MKRAQRAARGVVRSVALGLAVLGSLTMAAPGDIRRVSVSSSGEQANAAPSPGGGVSANGRYVVFASAASNLFTSDTNGMDDEFVHDLETGTTERVNVGGGASEANKWSYRRWETRARPASGKPGG